MQKRMVFLAMVILFLTAIAPIFSTLKETDMGTVNAQGSNALPDVSFPSRFDTSPRALRDLIDKPLPPRARAGRDFEPGRPLAIGNSNPKYVDPLAAVGFGGVSASILPNAATYGTPVDPNYRVAPPDTTGDLGPSHYVQWVNLRYSIYTVTRDASGDIATFNLVNGFPKNGNVLWQGFGGPCETYNDGDPIVQYDQLADRWVLTQFAVSARPYTQCVAVSTGPDPTGTYYRYSYSYSNSFNDYPKMSVWPDGYYITYNMFLYGSLFSGGRVCAFERSKMLTGASARQICKSTSSSYPSLLPADLEGSTLPPSGSPNFLLSMTSNSIRFWKYAVNWSTGKATLTGPTTISGVAAFTRACNGGTCVPQPETTQQLASLADRLMYRLSYRNFGGGRESLLVNHSVAANNASGIRWYELSNASGKTMSNATPIIRQQGTYAPSPDFRWMGSAAMDKTGGIAIGYNISNSTSIKPSIRYAYRGPNDALGTLGSEVNILDGTGSQTASLARWGDYSTISVDPTNGCTMVFTTEYIPSNGNFNWSTYIYSFKLSTCQ